MYDNLIDEWLKLAGGRENIIRIEQDLETTTLTLKDRMRMDLSYTTSIGVEADIQFTGGQCRLRLRDESGAIYDSLQEMGIGSQDKTSLQEAMSKIKGKFSVMQFVSSVFRPLMPVILGAAVIKIITALILFIDSLGSEGSSSLMDNQTFTIFRIIGDSALYLLPVLAAVSTAYRLKSNIYAAAVIGGFMFYPEVAPLFSGEKEVYFLGQQLASQLTFYSSILWVMLTVCAAAYLERGIARLNLKGLTVGLAPFLTLLILVPFMLLVLGYAAQWLDEKLPPIVETNVADAPILTLVLLGAFFVLIWMIGLPSLLLPVILNELLMNSSSLLLSGMLAAVVAQAGASLAAGLRSKEASFRSMAFCASGTALFGIIEPALYAVNMRRKSSFFAAMLGGAAGGLYFGWLSVGAFALGGSSSLLELPLYIKPGSLNLLHASVGVVISFAVSCVLTYIFSGKRDKSTVSH
ncbi:PTS transporter subunit EIIC [Paenibacillus sp. AN1007]|uniref:PTS transporter subunit EIIC n=1 Tax=Paenibacillus sp. AN1007 TaxID=3151385 RepID=A0AAU8NCL7_9BACL